MTAEVMFDHADKIRALVEALDVPEDVKAPILDEAHAISKIVSPHGPSAVDALPHHVKTAIGLVSDERVSVLSCGLVSAEQVAEWRLENGVAQRAYGAPVGDDGSASILDELPFGEMSDSELALIVGLPRSVIAFARSEREIDECKGRGSLSGAATPGAILSSYRENGSTVVLRYAPDEKTAMGARFSYDEVDESWDVVISRSGYIPVLKEVR